MQKYLVETLQLAVQRFQAVEYDIMDIAGEAKKSFDDDFFLFRCSIKELDRRLGSSLKSY